MTSKNKSTWIGWKIAGIYDPEDKAHITLAYIGTDVNDRDLINLQRLVFNLYDFVSGRFYKTPLVVDGFDVFGEPGKQVHVALIKLPKNLLEFRSILVAHCGSKNINVSGRYSYTPHISLPHLPVRKENVLKSELQLAPRITDLFIEHKGRRIMSLGVWGP